MSLGVVIGRFEIPELHEGHKKLIQYALDHNDHVLVIIGESAARPFNGYCMPVELRRQIVRSSFPNKNLYTTPVRNQESCDTWSRHVDTKIDKLYELYDEITGLTTLYCGRDGFAPLYTGKYKVEILNLGVDEISATNARDAIGAMDSEAFRAGYLYAFKNKPPQSYQTVDIAILTEYYPKYILIGRKHNSTNWVLPGGFVEAGETLEQAATRELKEEIGLELTLKHYHYVDSFVVPDWRYKAPRNIDRICSALFLRKSVSVLKAKAGDDLAEVKLVTADKLDSMLAEHHKIYIPHLKKVLGS